jgi:hypothetical protein
MDPTLIEESTSNRIPYYLEVLVKSLEGCEESVSSTSEIDLIAALLYVLMIETGYSPLGVEGCSISSSDYGFSIHKLNYFCSMPANWKNIKKNSYEMSFILGRFAQYPCRLLIIPVDDDVLIINLLITNLIEERNRYTLGIQPSKYVNPTSTCIAAKFRHLKDLSLKFKNSLSHPARSVILTKEGIMNASLLGIPDEVKIRIFKYLKVSDFLKVSLVCKYLCSVAEDDGLWKYFALRDYPYILIDYESLLVDTPEMRHVINAGCWKDEYRREHKTRYMMYHMGKLGYPDT